MAMTILFTLMPCRGPSDAASDSTPASLPSDAIVVVSFSLTVADLLSRLKTNSACLFG